MSTNCDKPCATCPFLTKNFGRENPAGFNILRARAKAKGEKLLDWYSDKNLIRLWREGLRKGEAMLCHSSDSNASAYGGFNASEGHEKICTGALLAVFLHIKYLEKLILDQLNRREVQELYRMAAGKYPLTKKGQSVWVMNFAFGRVGYPYGLKIPPNIEGAAGKEISVPWEDTIINRTKTEDNDLKEKNSAKTFAAT